MFLQLFAKECVQTAKSLIYWLVVLALILDFATQLGNLEIMEKPREGQEDYGWRASDDKELIMESTLGMLAEEYAEGSYITYPIGFYKQVTLNDRDDQKISAILKETTGLDGKEEVETAIEDWYAAHPVTEVTDGVYMETEALKLTPAEGLNYERFGKLMDQVDELLGGGSNYSEDNRSESAMVPMTYEDALAEYNVLTEKDHLTGGYARLFSDYMGIFLGILPVFLSVTRTLRDRRAEMQELIYTRKCSSAAIVLSRYLSMLVMLILPVLILSLLPFAQCLEYARAAGLSVDLLAFVKYTFGWLTPTIMTSLAVGMFLTELTDTALAILVQGGWWFVSIFASAQNLGGGAYGWNLIPRHNTEMNWQGYHDAFSQLAANRILYALIATALVALTALIYAQKRKGRLQLHGKILANRKNKSKA